MIKRLSLDDLIEQLINLRDSTKQLLQVSVLVGDDVFKIVEARKGRRGMELLATEMNANNLPPTGQEIEVEAQQIRQRWSVEEEHRRRGLNQSDALISGIRVCSTFGFYDFLEAIEETANGH